MRYSYRNLDSTNCRVRIALGSRDIGKTFPLVRRGLNEFLNKGTPFVYIVETIEMVATLCQNNGFKFFQGVKEWIDENPKWRGGKLYKALSTASATDDDEGEKLGGIIKSGSIMLNGEICGFIVALSDFMGLKRNNFPKNIKLVILDEFIPEIVTARNINAPRKLVSLLQSIMRDREFTLYLLGNSVRQADVILSKFGILNFTPGEIIVKNDEYGPLIAFECIDPNMYKDDMERKKKSVNGRISKMLDESNLDDNVFRDALNEENRIPLGQKPSKFIFCVHGEMGSVRVHMLKNGAEYYIFRDYGDNEKARYCIDKKHIAPLVSFNPHLEKMMRNIYIRKLVKFDDAFTLSIFKSILKLKESI